MIVVNSLLVKPLLFMVYLSEHLKEFISIKKVDGQMSDTHHGGASVFKVTLDNGYQILYKPHQVFNEIKYLQLYEWCASKCNIFPYIYKIIDKDNYGWVEFVTYEGCDNKKEIENSIPKFIILLSLLMP